MTMPINERHSRRPLLLDGPTGTELQRRGFETRLPLWSARALLDAQELVVRIHRDYIEAGADVITANTFRTNRRVIERSGLPAELARELTVTAVDLAQRARRESDRPDVLIAGSAAPVEDCYAPELVPSDRELQAEHAEHVELLAGLGCDIILIETMNTLREAEAACSAAADLDTPTMVSVVTDATGENMLSGESLGAAATALTKYRPTAVLTNCSAPRAVLRATELLASLRDGLRAEWEFGGYPNSGEPDAKLGWEFVHTVPVVEFVETARTMIDLGARVIGSCCGTTPEYTRALRALGVTDEL